MLHLRSFRVCALFLAPTLALCSPPPTVDGPDFSVLDSALSSPPVVIAYGDTRFTDPSEKGATNPKVRDWLVDQIAKEKPDALLISGDLPWHGAKEQDYDAYRKETTIWRDEHLRIYPALGNHELYSHNLITNTAEGLKNWWAAFPELQGKRWYSVQIGSKMYALNLDTNSSLHAGSEQMTWIENQLAHLPSSVQFVFINMHHPPVADVQRFGDPTHNPGRNETNFAHYLDSSPLRSRVRFVVIAGHIHNYERFNQNGITYLVSGGGGAAPRAIHRRPADLFQSNLFPNYHYIKFVLDGNALHATMYRVADPNAPQTPTWQTPDAFNIPPPAASK